MSEETKFTKDTGSALEGTFEDVLIASLSDEELDEKMKQLYKESDDEDAEEMAEEEAEEQGMVEAIAYSREQQALDDAAACCAPGEECESEEPEEQTIEVRIPGPDDPGFLRRARTLTELQDQITADERERGNGNISSETMQSMADFLVPYLVVPEGIDPEDAVWDLSKTQYEAVMSAIGGGNQTVPKESGEDSPEPTKED